LVPCCLLLLALAGLSPAGGEAPETSLSELRSLTGDLLRAEATAAEGAEKQAAVTALCDLYVVLKSDPRHVTSDMLRGDAAKLRRRLIGIGRRTENRLKRAGVPKPNGLAAEVDSAIRAALESESRPPGRIQSAAVTAPPDGAGGAALADPGWRLVELIQRVVTPEFWDRLGGPGSIHYFAIRRVLVVRATTDVHEQIKDLLTALR
jgi:predicted flap endonuclease-1-like 5' DNA nuclease